MILCTKPQQLEVSSHHYIILDLGGCRGTIADKIREFWMHRKKSKTIFSNGRIAISVTRRPYPDISVIVRGENV